ncbi:MAG: OmpA family protein [Epsilonproteobacteria bacterium]|nr:OmpA family protein [Campylobacterota bacterium]
MMKNFGLLALAVVLFCGGCGKDKKKETGKKQEAVSTKMAQATTSDIPVLKEEVENFIDEDAIAEFAFVDDEQSATQEMQTDTTGNVVVASNDDVDLDDATVVAALEHEQHAQEQELLFEEDEEAESYAFKTVYFDFNKHNVRPDQREAVDYDTQVARVAAEEGRTVVVEGHCDQMGDAAYNILVSQRRADTIKKEMVKNGVSQDKIKTVGYGFERPVVWTDKTERDAKIRELSPNRRAEILVS